MANVELTGKVIGGAERFAGGRARGLGCALAVAVLACGCGGGTGSGGTTIRFQLTTAEDVAGLASVRLTAGSSAKTYAVQALSATAEVFDLPVSSSLTGSVDVAALARPASGCMGYGGTGIAYISAAGSVVTVTILMTPQDICQTTGTGGTGGSGGTTGTAGASGAAGTSGTTGRGGTTGTGGSISTGSAGTGGSVSTGTAGTGGSTGAGGMSGRGGTTGSGGATGGTSGTIGTGGRGGTGGSAGTGGSVAGAGGSAGRGGTGGTAGAAGTAGTAGAAGRGGSGGTGGSGGAPSCSVAVGGRPAAVSPPSLSRCVEYSQNDTGATCNTTTNANNPIVYDIAVSPDGQYLATAGSHRTSTPDTTDSANDRVRIWRLVGNTPTLCGSINISNPMMGPAYVAFSPNGQYLAVAWRRDYVYVYSVPGFTMVGSILSSYGPLYGVGFSPDSQTVFSIDYDSTLADGTLYADRVNGDPVALAQLGVDPDVLAVSPVAGTGNTSTIAVGGFDGTAGVYVFNGTTISGPTIVDTGTSAAAWAARFNPAGNLLAIGTDQGYVHFWGLPLTSTTPTGNPIDVGISTVTGLSFSPQGTHVAVAFDFETDIFNVSTRAFVSRASAVDYVDSVSFSASGAAVISGEDSCGRVLVCSD